MIVYIHYDPRDGEIVGWQTGGGEPVPISEDYRLLYAENLPDPKRQKIDVATLVMVDKTADEIVAALAPTEHEIRSAVFRTLQATDFLMLPDQDYLTPQKLAAWIAYRKTLRDLSKHDPPLTPAGVLKAWPLDPNGVDAVAHLRDRK